MKYYKTTEFFFSLFFLDLALSPLYENYVSEFAYICITGIFISLSLLSAAISIAKLKKQFVVYMSNDDTFTYINLLICVLGLAIAYIGNSKLYNVWVFFTIMDVLNIIFCKTFKKHNNIKNLKIKF